LRQRSRLIDALLKVTIAAGGGDRAVDVGARTVDGVNIVRACPSAIPPRGSNRPDRLASGGPGDQGAPLVMF
jgi:hypothetical protein